jgi:hypothetical protein
MTATNSIISQPSPYSVSEIIDRLVTVLQSKDITIFARIPIYLQQRFSLSDELVKNIDVMAPLIYQAFL